MGDGTWGGRGTRGVAKNVQGVQGFTEVRYNIFSDLDVAEYGKMLVELLLLMIVDPAPFGSAGRVVGGGGVHIFGENSIG